MPRVSKGPRYYGSKGAWYATLGGETVLLVRGPKKQTEEEAREKYDAEVAARRAEVDGDRGEVWGVLNAYLFDLDNRVRNGDAAPNLLRMHTAPLTGFGTVCAGMRVRDLRPQHLTAWLAAMRKERYSPKLRRITKWSAATEKLARAAINRAFNWAAHEAGLITLNPLKRHPGKKARRQKRRPSQNRVAITAHEHTLLVEQAQRRSCKDFLCLLKFLYSTGARPAEMCGVRAEEWEADKSAFRIAATPENHGRFKLAHLGEDRLVYVPDDLLPLVRELMVKYPEGPLFRNERGTAWTTVTLCARFTSIKNAANRAADARGVQRVRKEVTAYSYRHGFVTRWVVANRSLTVLCQLLNTSETMVRQHYSHLFEQTETLRGALNTFARDAEASPETAQVAVAV
jgi:integrase